MSDVAPKCKCCDNLVKHNYTKGKKWSTYCSAKCRANDPEFKQQIIEKYGQHPGHTSQAIEKRKSTCNKKYGVEFPLQDVNIREQTTQTCIINNGGQLHGSAIISKKIINTMMDKYNVQYSGQSSELLKKQYITNLQRYGVEHPLQSDKIFDKVKQSNIDKYGVEYFTQYHMMDNLQFIEDYDWLFDQYINQNKTASQIASELNVNNTTICNYLRYHEINIKYLVGYSYKCINWLESIMYQDGSFIQHALNEGEYSIPGTRYKADGYCQETNTIYEFHGDVFHGNPLLFNDTDKCHPFDKQITAGELYNKTLLKEQQIKELGYNLIVMWENDYVITSNDGV